MTEAKDYRDTVFLPKTDFPMKAGLPQKEPGILARWAEMRLYETLREKRRGREKFILHDGPPYANGDMHIGHAMQRILKDTVVRTQSLLGKDVPFVPGWDCHGLPIEWKVEEEYRKKKRNKDEVPVEEFRAECRAYAQHWVNIQREQIKRLGIIGDWDNPYLTMDFEAEATIVSELMKFAETGQLYRGAKPVMWSPVEKTALAEAEIEYEDITSTQIDVAFEIVSSPIPELVGAHAVIWTTTPWTIPVNQAIAYGPDVEYRLISYKGKQCLVADHLLDDFLRRMGELPSYAEMHEDDERDLRDEMEGVVQPESAPSEEILALKNVRVRDIPTPPRFKGSDLAGTIARHPMAKLFQSPLPLAGGAGGGPVDQQASLSDAPTPNPSRKREGDNIDPTSPLAEFFLRPRPFLPGDFVTTETGTGLVHMAPDHGEDDFDLCKANGLEPVFAVMGDGKYRDDWAWLGGQGSVINPKFNAPDGPICTALREAGGLLAASADYQHSYPHSWRSKAKVIYRCTPQWFVPMDKELPSRLREGPGVGQSDAPALDGSGPPSLPGGLPPATHQAALPPASGRGTLRETALTAIADTRWVPEKGRNRITAMVEGRPDWVISRQRAWGVPIALFVNRKSGQYLYDPAVNARIVTGIREGGVDAWSDEAAQGYLGDAYRLEDYERVTDILDVWFDSGCTHAFVLESGKWPDLVTGNQADLYLEGSDQHRGWFQSSLLESCGTRGRAPYKAVLTHGFTMDQKGMKMSKSLGNTINPLDLMRDNGADILRLWALTVDFTEDHRIGNEILKGVSDQYRKLRNTFRYLLGALEGFSDAEKVAVADMPELERYVLHLLADMDTKLRVAVNDFDFNAYVKLLTNFANEDLSAFFFDIRKDSLYCDAPTNPKRMAYRTVLDILFHALVRYAAPVLVFTSEEVWGTRFPDAESVHFSEWPEVDAGWLDEKFCEAYADYRQLRTDILPHLEALRREKIIGSSLEAAVSVYSTWGDPSRLSQFDFAELFIVSQADWIVGTVPPSATGYLHHADGNEVEQAGFEVHPTAHHKCGRCWRHLPEVAEDGALCGRCEEVVGG